MNFPIAHARGLLAMPVAVSLLIGCTVVKINSDGTDTVEHSGGGDVGAQLANRVCKKARAARAEIISTVPKDESQQSGEGRNVTTFRCVY